MLLKVVTVTILYEMVVYFNKDGGDTNIQENSNGTLCGHGLLYRGLIQEMFNG